MTCLRTVLGSLQPASSYDVPAQPDGHSYAARPMLDGLVLATATQLVRMGAGGNVRWRHDLGTPADPDSISVVSCEFSLDGQFVWLYVPDALLDRGPDRLLVLDASGTTVAQARLNTAGHAAILWAHPDGHTIVAVGEGQEGWTILRCQTDAGEVLTEEYPWSDRVLIDFSPDGSQFITVDHTLCEAARFHAYPSGEVVAVVTKSDLGDYDDEAQIDSAGGYVDATTTLVWVVGYDEDTQEHWHRCHLVDAVSGQVRGEWHVESEYVDNVKPLGDGTWLLLQKGQHPQRHVP